jgi:two-component system, cell cycle sensor histidine kinase and response regulator CckA
MWVYADPVQLEQVLYNLCVNARDAMPSGGRLTIGVGHRPPATHRGEAMVALEVSDSGTGMGAETLEHIFEPYFTTKGAAGTGLGLATSHRIVSEAGGRILVSSVVGQGSVVTVLLPSHAPDETEDGSAGPAALPTDGTETVLIVEDEADVRNVIGRALRRHGYRVLEAPDTNAALHLWEAHRDAVRLVISDLVLPDGSGGDLVFRLRHERPELPVVLMSGYDPSEVGEDGLARVAMVPGCVWLQKPLAPDQLFRVVRSTLDASGA